MPRSPSDATRFTATGPYVSSSQPSSSGSPSFASNPPGIGSAATSSSQISFGSPAPDGETPQQKISRLRAAAALARRGKESQFDKVVRVGRLWADRVHRVTAISLIGLTVLSGVVATAGITDMLLHNRRRRNEWLAEQQRKSAIDLAEARKAQAVGRETEDQRLLINRERVAEEAAEAKRNRPGVFKRASSYLFSGLSKEEQKGGRLGGAVSSAASATQSVKEEMLGEKEDRGVLQVIEDRVEPHRRQVEKVEESLKPFGGPLDRQAQVTIDAITGSRSWTSWLTGR